MYEKTSIFFLSFIAATFGKLDKVGDGNGDHLVVELEVDSPGVGSVDLDVKVNPAAGARVHVGPAAAKGQDGLEHGFEYGFYEVADALDAASDAVSEVLEEAGEAGLVVGNDAAVLMVLLVLLVVALLVLLLLVVIMLLLMS